MPVNCHTSNCSLLALCTMLPRVIYGFKSENGLGSRKVLDVQEGMYDLLLHLPRRLHHKLSDTFYLEGHIQVKLSCPEV